LHGQGGGAGNDAPGPQVLACGPENGGEIYPGMLPKALIFRGNKRGSHQARYLPGGELHRPEALGSGCQSQDLAVAVEDQGAGGGGQGGRINPGSRFQVNSPTHQQNDQQEPAQPRVM
jgi:hypothetical protein